MFLPNVSALGADVSRTNAPRTEVARTNAPQFLLKQSIRDMIRLQRDYQLSDELFWEIFNARVLLNQDVDVNEFVRDIYAN